MPRPSRKLLSTLLPSMVLLSLGSSCEAEPPYVTVDVTITAADVVEPGILRGAGVITVRSDVEQAVALDALDVRVGAAGDTTVNAIEVTAIDAWPVQVGRGGASRTFAFGGALPAACADIPFHVEVDARLVGEVGPASHGYGYLEVGVRRPIAVDDLPWAWSVDVGVALDAGARGAALAVATDEVAWSLTPDGGVVRIDREGGAVVRRLGAHELRATEDAVYTLAVDGVWVLSRLTADGRVLWSTTFPLTVDVLHLVVALPDRIVVAGTTGADLALGDVRVPATSSFMAAFHVDAGLLVGARGGAERVVSGVARGDGFVAAVGLPNRLGLAAFDGSLQPAWTADVAARDVAVASDGRVFTAFADAVTRMSPELEVEWTSPTPCSREGEPPRDALVALDDGGALNASGAMLSRVDTAGRRVRGVPLEGELRLVQEHGTLFGAWKGPGGDRVGRLDVTRLGEVGL